MTSDYQRIEQLIGYLDSHFRAQPSLAELAAVAGLSEAHLQRLFTRWAGISPKRFLQHLTASHAERLLAAHPVLEASLESGLSGSGRLHDLMITLHAVTPGEIRSGGEGLTLRYGSAPSPFGPCLLAMSERGVCRLAFTPPERPETVRAELAARWPRAHLVEDTAAAAAMAAAIFAGAPPRRPLALWVRGSNFQLQVWQALLRVPPGQVVSYQALAQAVGRPGAARAVGNAVGDNPVAYLIPCHRVIRKSAGLGDYRWGRSRKQVLLAWERGRAEIAADEEPHPPPEARLHL